MEPAEMTDAEIRNELEHHLPRERLEAIRREIEDREGLRGTMLICLRTLSGLPMRKETP